MSSSAPMAPPKKAVHFGCGAIGRAFVGLFLHQAGYEVVFVDVHANMVDKINSEKKYTVTEIGATSERKVVVDNIRAVDSTVDSEKVKAEIATADIVTCAVGVRVLRFIAPLIAQGINSRSPALKPLTVIACENTIGNTSILYNHVKESLSPAVLANQDVYARFANCAVDRIAPVKPPAGEEIKLDMEIEEFHEWIVELAPFHGLEPPVIPAIQFVEDLQPYITRKLYTVNTAHATAAYLGHAAGIEYISDAMKNPDIRDLTRGSICDSAGYIITKYNIPKEERFKYVEKIIDRISNPAIKDTVARVGREPIRKLSRSDRLIGPAAELAELGLEYGHIMHAIEKALYFLNVEGDEQSLQLANILDRESARYVATEICGLKSEDKLYKPLVELVEKVQRDQKGTPVHDRLPVQHVASEIRADL